jgi:putative lipoprotein
MIRRISWWGAAAVAIVLAIQLSTREPPSAPTPAAAVVGEPPARTSSPVPPRAPRQPERASGGDERPPVDEALQLADAASAPPSAAAPDRARRFVFDCGSGVVFSVRTLGAEATLSSAQALGAEVVTLQQMESDAGARYSRGDVSYSSRGGLATFEIRDRVYADCTSSPGAAQTAAALRRGPIFRARGNEPSWLLEVSQERIELATDLGTRRVDFPYREPTLAGNRTTYRTFSGSQELNVVIDRIPCNDTMSGEPFEAIVTVTFENRTYHGCGQAP